MENGLTQKKMRERYNYADAGFSSFFRRSIDNPVTPVATLSELAKTATQLTRNVNFDQGQVAGSMSGVTRIGDKINMDGIEGRISIFDESGNEIGRIGKL